MEEQTARFYCALHQHRSAADLAELVRDSAPCAITMAPVLFAVRLEHGAAWDWSRGLREQEGWDEHARFLLDGLRP